MTGFALKYWRRIFLSVLLFANILVWNSAAFGSSSSSKLTVAFLNIGQGDSIYIESPTGTQVVFDGGPDSSVLRELGAVMPFGDHSLNMLVVSHPDSDHFAGFLDVVNRYSIGAELSPGIISTTPAYVQLQNELSAKKVPKLVARAGQVYDLGGGALLYILFPDRDVSNWETNEGCVVAKLVYGKTAVILNGDSPQNIDRYLVAKDGAALGETWEGGETILKVGHHGSKTSTDPELIADLKPIDAVISAGAGNKFGHPHKETLDTLAAAGVPALITFKEGRIVFQSDGEHFVRE